jgi:hypothetical protein
LSQSPGVVIQTVDSSFFLKAPKAHPSRVYVVSYRDGSIRSFSGAPAWADRASSRFCYIVDTSEQYASNRCTLTSAVDAYAFSVELSVTWRVTDPEAAVRADLGNGSELVLAAVQDHAWQIARRYAPEESAAAEAAVRSAFSAGLFLDAGITVLRAVARFHADDSVTATTRALDEDTVQATLEGRRLARLREAFDGSDMSAMLLHLAQHPDDTGSVLAMIKAAPEAEHDRHMALLDRLLAHDLINDADAQPFRDIAASGLGKVSGRPALAQVTMVPIARPKPPLGLPPGIASGGGAPAVPGAGAAPASPGGTAPAAGPGPGGGQAVTPGPVTGELVVEAEDDPGTGTAASPPGSATGGVVDWKPLKKPARGSA